MVDFKRERLKCFMKQLDSANADRTQRIAMVSIGKCDKFFTVWLTAMLPVLESHFDGDLHRR